MGETEGGDDWQRESKQRDIWRWPFWFWLYSLSHGKRGMMGEAWIMDDWTILDRQLWKMEGDKWHAPSFWTNIFYF